MEPTTNQIEIWKSIPGYEGLYEASDMGNFRSIKNGIIKILKPRFFWTGYVSIQLSKNSKHKTFTGHKLVWLAFNGEIPDNYVIDHIDMNKSNNNLSNLRLLTNRENTICCYADRRKKNKTTSKYQNVVRRLSHNHDKIYWCAYSNIAGKMRYIGNYKEEEMARCVAELARAGILPSRVRAKIEAEKNKINNA